MIDVKVHVFTDNQGGKILATRISQLGFTPVFIKESKALADIRPSDDVFNILIVDIAHVQKEKIIRIIKKYPLKGILKLIVFDDCSECSEFYDASDYYRIELFTRPVDIRAFLFVFEKIVLVARYRRFMKKISREAEFRIKTVEDLLAMQGGDLPGESRARDFIIKVAEFEKWILDEHSRINESIRQMSLLRNTEYMAMKDRIRAEELLGELRRQELLDAKDVINAQESLIDYSSKELHETKRILDARENVQELSRVEAMRLHEELVRLRVINSELEKRIEILEKDNESLRNIV